MIVVEVGHVMWTVNFVVVSVVIVIFLGEKCGDKSFIYFC
jgi:hypothetical protein